jgi:intracellular septation protein A
MLDADTILWASIVLMTGHLSILDVTVIHGRYTLDAKQKLNIVLHQFFGIAGGLGVLFQKKLFIQMHLFLVSMIIACWLWFDGCFMAKWQRDSITYKSEEDFIVIQKSKAQRQREFFTMIIPLFLIDLYKLSSM